MSDLANLANLAISDTGFVFDPHTGATFTLNASGLTVLLALREGLVLDAIVARLRERFESTSPEARDDVLDFVQMLRLHGIVQSGFNLESSSP